MGAGDGAQEAGLADAVAAEEAGDLAHLGGEGDLAEGDGGAVVEIDLSNFEHDGQRPR